MVELSVDGGIARQARLVSFLLLVRWVCFFFFLVIFINLTMDRF